MYNKWIHIFYNNPEIPWDTHLKSIGTSISGKQQDKRSGHPLSSGDESWFPVFDWRGKPCFQKHLKRSFPLGICMWEDPLFYASSEMDPEKPWLERSPNFPAEDSCMFIVHITRWKDVWVPYRDRTESPRPPHHLKKGPNMPLTTRKPRGVHCFNFDDAWKFFTIVRNPDITVSNRKRDVNSHLTSRSVRIVLPRLLYIPELSLIPRQVSWLHWPNSSFEWTSPP